SDGSFRPIGTIGDYSFELGNVGWSQSFNSDPQAVAEESLLSQLLMQCSGHFPETCTPTGTPPDYISPCSGTRFTGSAVKSSHEVVRICKPTVEYITGITGQDVAAGPRLTSRYRVVSGPG